jgi:hypothetical protein
VSERIETPKEVREEVGQARPRSYGLISAQSYYLQTTALLTLHPQALLGTVEIQGAIVTPRA